AAGVTTSADGRTVSIKLRPSVKFHDGTAVDAQAVKVSLEGDLRKSLGSLAKNISAFRVGSDLELDIDLQERSNFVVEALDSSIRHAAGSTVGTGPFYVTSSSPVGIEMAANRSYYLGAPAIDRVMLKPYDSLRGAWADMLRGQLDMLYEIGSEGLDSLQPSSNVHVFIHRRHYAYLILLNGRESQWQAPALRRALNQAIDRPRLVGDGLQGHAVAADGPVWPDHWAYDATLPRFTYEPAD